MRLAKQFVSKIRLICFNWLYRQKQRTGEPISYALPGNITFNLYPLGQIAEGNVIQ